MLYLSGTYSQILPQYRAQFGYMLNVNRQIGGEQEAVQYPWMLDNGAFNGKWREDVWQRRLEQLAPHTATCVGSVVPDVVADHDATLERWHVYAPFVKALGYKAAFATQTGATVDNVPWDEIDVLFVGDSEDRRRTYCWPLIDEALRRGMWVHVGRVNSASAIARYGMADSVDGTNFSYGSHMNQKSHERILWAVRQCNARRTHDTLFTPDSWAQPTP